MFHHHDLLAVLPDIYNAGVGQEYDCDEPPDQVLSRVLTERRYLCQTYGVILQVGLDMAFVAVQIELFTILHSQAVIQANRQGVQCLKQSRNPAQVRVLQCQIPRSALGQHLPDTLSLFLFPLTRLCHLRPEVLGVKDQAIEQESRLNVAAAVLALVPSDSKSGNTTADRTSLESTGRIDSLST